MFISCLMRCQWKTFKKSLEQLCNAREKIGTSVFLQFLGREVSGITCREVHREEKEILHAVLQVLISKKQHLGNTVSEKTRFKELQWLGDGFTEGCLQKLMKQGKSPG